MLQYNTMRFATDEFSFDKRALLTTQTPFDTAGQNFITGFDITGAEPVGSERKFLFRVDEVLYRFANGTLETVERDITFDNVLTYGNTAAELAEVTDVPDWVGKKVYPIVALRSPDDATVMPSVKLGLKVKSSSDVYEQNVETPAITLTSSNDATPRIVEIQTDTATTGNGAVLITARVQNNGEWGEYVPTQTLRDTDATAIQFKIRYTVSIIGGNDSAKVNKIVVRHTTGTATVSGDTADIYSVMQDYKYPLGICAVTIRHKRLIDSKINAFVNFGSSVKHRTFLPLGVSTGGIQTLTLGENGIGDTGIDQATLQVFADGNPVVNFGYNTETSELTINLDAGLAITASYSYGRSREVWQPMTIDVDQEPYDDGTFLTRFTYALPEGEQDDKTVTNIRLQLLRTSGTVTNEVLGIANGVTQQFVLKHAAQAETLNVNAQFSYNEDTQVVTCIGTSGTELVASYDWLGENHTIYSWAAAWSPAI